MQSRLIDIHTFADFDGMVALSWFIDTDGIVFGDLVAWMRKSLYQRCIIGEKLKSVTIFVQPPDIDVIFAPVFGQEFVDCFVVRVVFTHDISFGLMKKNQTRSELGK